MLREWLEGWRREANHVFQLCNCEKDLDQPPISRASRTLGPGFVEVTAYTPLYERAGERQETRIPLLDGRSANEAKRMRGAQLLASGGRTVSSDPKGVMYEPNTLQPVFGSVPDLNPSEYHYRKDAREYLDRLHDDIVFEEDSTALSTLGLILLGRFIYFVIPGGPADVTMSDGSRLACKDEILFVNDEHATEDNIGRLLKGSDQPGTSVQVAVKKATWFGEEILERVIVVREDYPKIEVD
ncbi:hypothetical protein GUITHDRAFT_119708 [Guillardia theta CCMP2712]|uniref:PDZ domain-containing protein n=2 Tax=Guillardia theta TaxID=55529 RepID=L1IE45_GUITC|nr:hypothetical protein GUITHDRAFT_119708 [Guillardia theta CCMP2712]EKX34100.1 hypothetical protein GUITHDRAFT_119708 [Guillardia theta CCMP2712]|eukprot:XP_005821080.1 hypothetical protein GUITHDRAFT_119708 [Guillardia theta CCMP2712]